MRASELRSEHAMNQRFGKTKLGSEEIKNRSRKLSRPARNLLLVIDTCRSASAWLQLVHRATEDDLKQLLSDGLIEEKQADAAAPSARTIEQAIATLTHAQLYALLTSQARDRLGLVGGFKLILDVEKCANIDELRALGLKFLEMVEAHQGQAQAQQMRRALGFAT
jgi:hypothetical protein